MSNRPYELALRHQAVRDLREWKVAAARQAGLRPPTRTLAESWTALVDRFDAFVDRLVG